MFFDNHCSETDVKQATEYVYGQFKRELHDRTNFDPIVVNVSGPKDDHNCYSGLDCIREIELLHVRRDTANMTV